MYLIWKTSRNMLKNSSLWKIVPTFHCSKKLFYWSQKFCKFWAFNLEFISFCQSQEQIFSHLRSEQFQYNLIKQLRIFLAPLWLLPTRIAYLNWKLQSFSAITKPLKLCTHCCFSGWFISFFHVNYVDKYIQSPFFQKRNQHFLYFMFIGSVVEKDGGIGLLKTLCLFFCFLILQSYIWKSILTILHRFKITCSKRIYITILLDFDPLDIVFI